MTNYELSRIANEQYDRIAKLEARNVALEAALDDYLRVIGTIKVLPMPFTMAERLSEVQLRMLELKAARDD